MFEDKLSYFQFIQSSIPMMNLIASVMIIILIIIALSSGGVTGASGYSTLIIAVIVGITSLAVSQLFKPESMTANKMSEYLQRT